MTEQYYTGRYGDRFMIEPAGDFDDNGRPKRGRGWHLNAVHGSDIRSIGWYETESQAINAIWSLGGENNG